MRVQLLLHSLEKSVERAPLEVEEVAAAAEAKSLANTDAGKVCDPSNKVLPIPKAHILQE